jgi:hypothetical protein
VRRKKKKTNYEQEENIFDPNAPDDDRDTDNEDLSRP